MHCEKMNELLDAYLDGELAEAEQQEAEQHLKECEECALLVRMGSDLRTEAENVPEPFSAAWREAIRKEEEMENKQQKKQSLRSVLAIAAVFVFIVGGTLLSGGSERKPASDEVYYTYTTGAGGGNGAAMKMAAPSLRSNNAGVPNEVVVTEETAEDVAADALNGQKEQKLIRRVDFTIKTREFDHVVQQLQDVTAQMGGRVEYFSQYGDVNTGALRTASFTLRVPSGQLDAFLSRVEQVGTFAAFTNQVEDVSSNYYDLQTRLETQKAKLARLQALMQQAADVSDLVEIESSIADTQYLIDSYTSKLNGMDDKVDYSTVSVFVEETRVVETKEATFWERVGAGIRDTLNNTIEFLRDAAIFTLSVLPVIAVVAVVVVIVRLIWKRKKK